MIPVHFIFFARDHEIDKYVTIIYFYLIYKCLCSFLKINTLEYVFFKYCLT